MLKSNDSNIRDMARRLLATEGAFLTQFETVTAYHEFCESLGAIKNTTSVEFNPEASKGLDSGAAMRLHNDHPEARFISWYCVSPAIQGGESLLMDSRQLIDIAPDSLIKDLKRIDVRVPKVAGLAEYPPSRKMLSDDGRLYYAPWLVYRKSMKNNLLQSLHEFLARSKAAKKISLRLEKTYCLIINNYFVMHGRTKLEQGERNRLLIRNWIF